jgi:hypothetical protein
MSATKASGSIRKVFFILFCHRRMPFFSTNANRKNLLEPFGINAAFRTFPSGRPQKLAQKRVKAIPSQFSFLQRGQI